MSGIAQPPGPENGRVLTFALGAEGALPPIPAEAPIPEPPPRLDVAEQEVERGGALYAKYCAFCHGSGVVSGGTVPDLRHLPAGFHDNFDAIVRHGAMQSFGMPSFGDVLDEDDVVAIHAFVIEEAHADVAYRRAPRWWNALKDIVYDAVSWILMLFTAPSVHTA